MWARGASFHFTPGSDSDCGGDGSGRGLGSEASDRRGFGWPRDTVSHAGFPFVILLGYRKLQKLIFFAFFKAMPTRGSLVYRISTSDFFFEAELRVVQFESEFVRERASSFGRWELGFEFWASARFKGFEARGSADRAAAEIRCAS